MRTFTELQQQEDLKSWIGHQFGSRYLYPAVYRGPSFPRMLVRRFDGELSPAMVRPYADLMQALLQWLAAHPAVARLVKLEPLIEVGHDFVVRPYRLYDVSTDAYVDWEDPPEPPEALAQMRQALLATMGSPATPRESIIEHILRRSLIEPSGKTYFDEIDDIFIIVEPRTTCEEIEQWAALMTRSNEEVNK